MDGLLGDNPAFRRPPHAFKSPEIITKHFIGR